jgi:hypothetical protein
MTVDGATARDERSQSKHAPIQALSWAAIGGLRRQAVLHLRWAQVLAVDDPVSVEVTAAVFQ